MSPGTDDPFQRVRARALFAVVVLCALAIVLPIAWLEPMGGGVWRYPVVSVSFYLATVLVLALLCRRAGVDLSQLAGPLPPLRELAGSAVLAIPLLAFSVGTTWAIYLPLAYFEPEAVENGLLADWTLLVHTGQGYPFGPNALLIASGCLLAPVGEEFLFRGLLLHRWALHVGLGGAVWLSSLLFGLLHADVVGGVIFALVAAALYLGTRSLYNAIALHAASNVLAFSLAIFEIALTGKESGLDLESFRSLWWVGALGLAVGAPWTAYILFRYWRPEQWQLPHGAPATPDS